MSTTDDLILMKKRLEEYVTNTEMGLLTEPFTLEDFKTWIKDLENITDDGNSYEDGLGEGRDEIRNGLRKKIRDLSTTIDDIKEKLDELEEESNQEMHDECTL